MASLDLKAEEKASKGGHHRETSPGARKVVKKIKKKSTKGGD